MFLMSHFLRFVKIYAEKHKEKFAMLHNLTYLCKCYPEYNLFTLRKD